MKISYKVLQSYKSDIKTPEEVAQDLVMHTAEVEEIEYQGKHLEKVFIGEVKTCEKHPDSEKLNCTTVSVNGEIFPIVCGAPNVKVGIKVPVAIEWAQLAPDFIIKKTKIRWEVSQGMICSEDELWLIEERQSGILELPPDAPLNISMREYLEQNDAILEIDNKAINHRPDLFSHIGILREIYAITGEKFDFNYENKDFSTLESYPLENKIPEEVSRYIALKINGVENKQTPDYIKHVLSSAGVESKGLLVDVTNYSLYLYGQPTHCFDADKIDGGIVVRFAKDWEKFLALNDTEYELSSSDIVIADNSKVLALGGIIGGKLSSVTDETKNVVIEAATFDQAILRQTGKKLGIRTDALNVFEKDLLPEMAKAGASLIASELEKNCSKAQEVSYSDTYTQKQENITIPFDLVFINNLIGKTYTKEEVLNILKNLGINHEKEILHIPFWRKDLAYKADIAEEIARIQGYNNIEATIPSILSGAVIQDNIYKVKNDIRSFFTSKGFFDMYSYSFVNDDTMHKMKSSTQHLVDLKNPLSEELSHMKDSHIPNLMMSLELNSKEYKDLKLVEIEKIFQKNGSEIEEINSLAGVMTSHNDIAYYDMQEIVSDFFHNVGIYKYSFDPKGNFPSYAHTGRSAAIIIRGKQVGILWEIHPKVSKDFSIKKRVAFFEINIELLKDALYGKVKANDISEFQANNFDLSFIIDKTTKGWDIASAIASADQNLIKKVELFDIYENEEKLPWKRSVSFKIFIQSMEQTLDDKIKNTIIQNIVAKVAKKGGELR